MGRETPSKLNFIVRVLEFKSIKKKELQSVDDRRMNNLCLSISVRHVNLKFVSR